MKKSIKNLGTAENILILCARFWLKAHVFKCNTPLILIDHTFKAAKLDNSVRHYHTLMMGLSHLNKSNLNGAYLIIFYTAGITQVDLQIMTELKKIKIFLKPT